MNRIIRNAYKALFFSAALCFSSCAGDQSNDQVEKQIDDLISKMTLEEKIGQMTQLTLDVVGKGPDIFSSYMPFQIDTAMLDTVIGVYKVGSILNSPTNTAQTVETWEYIVKTIQDKAIATTGIPLIYGVDAIHGVTYTAGATFFPQQIGMGATFNRELVKYGAQITAYETRASNIPWNFSPVLDLGRDGRWARLWETYGEDVYLVSQMGEQCVIGYQGENKEKIDDKHVAACLKHFMGYGVSVSGKDRTPSVFAYGELIEKHLQPFKDAIEAGALSIMVNSGIINGVPVHSDKHLLTDLLKKQLNFDGVLVTDWADINNLYRRDKIAADEKEAIEMAINAGIDMSMVPYELSFCKGLKELVEEKRVSMERIDDAVRRILRMKFRLNLFEQPYVSYKDYPLFGSEAHEQVALNSAIESVTLLKNEENLLPLSKDKKVLVVGPNANSMRTLNGGWSYSWQGEKADQFAGKYNTILEAMINAAGENKISYSSCLQYNNAGKYYEEVAGDFAQAVNMGRSADVIMVCVGENSYTEKPGDLDDLYLSDNQQRLVTELSKLNKPVILVLNEGRPRIINKIEPLAKSVLNIYLPGNFGGDALAKVIYGEVNPSGKLPYTYPRYPQSLMTYDHKPSENQEKMEGAYDYESVVSVQYPFGYGLSYTSFEYSNLKIDKADFASDDVLTVQVDIKNTGNLTGKETVMLFSSDLVATITPDVRRLRGFEKIELNAGEQQTITFKLTARDLAFMNRDNKWAVEKGVYRLQVGNQVKDIRLSDSKVW